MALTSPEFVCYVELIEKLSFAPSENITNLALSHVAMKKVPSAWASPWTVNGIISRSIGNSK